MAGYPEGPDYWARLSALVDTAPPLGPDSRDRLAVLLRPGAEIALPAGTDLDGAGATPAADRPGVTA